MKKLTKQQRKKKRDDDAHWEFVNHIRHIQNSTHKNQYRPYCEYTENQRRSNTST